MNPETAGSRRCHADPDHPRPARHAAGRHPFITPGYRTGFTAVVSLFFRRGVTHSVNDILIRQFLYRSVRRVAAHGLLPVDHGHDDLLAGGGRDLAPRTTLGAPLMGWLGCDAFTSQHAMLLPRVAFVVVLAFALWMQRRVASPLRAA